MPIRSQARQLQAAGRRGDELLGHLTPGELVLPQSLQSPSVVAAIAQDARRKGINPSSLMAGSRFSSTNPATGLPEFADQAGHEQTFQELVAQIVERALAISGQPQLPGAPLPQGPAVPEGTDVPFFFDQVADFEKFGFGPEAILRNRPTGAFPSAPPSTGGGGTTGGLVDLEDFFDAGDDGDSDRDEEGPTSDKNPEDLTDDQLVDELTQSVKGFEGLGEKVMKGLADVLTVTGFSGLAQAARDKQTLEELQERGVLDPELTVDALQGVNVKEAIAVSKAFEESVEESRGGFSVTSLGGSAGDFEGVGFGGPSSLGGSAGDFEGTGFGGGFESGLGGSAGDFEGTDPSGTPSDPGQDPEGGFGGQEPGGGSLGGSAGDLGATDEESGGAGGPGAGEPDEGEEDQGDFDDDTTDDEDDSETDSTSGGTSSGFEKGGLIAFARTKPGDRVRITAEEGEFVIPREVVSSLGTDILNTFINNGPSKSQLSSSEKGRVRERLMKDLPLLINGK